MRCAPINKAFNMLKLADYLEETKSSSIRHGSMINPQTSDSLLPKHFCYRLKAVTPRHYTVAERSVLWLWKYAKMRLRWCLCLGTPWGALNTPPSPQVVWGGDIPPKTPTKFSAQLSHVWFERALFPNPYPNPNRNHNSDMTKKLCSSLYSTEMECYSQGKNCFLTTLWGLRLKYALHL